MIYGHFTLSEFEQRNGNPFLEYNGRWYRITETHVIRALDRVNYQAEECDAREVQAWLAEKVVETVEPEQVPVVAAVSSPDTGEDAGDEPDALLSTTFSVNPEQAEPGASSEAEDVAYYESHKDDESEWEEVSPPEESDEWAPVATETEHHEVPSLSAWAREHGWAGVGRISKKLREAYKAEFGE